MEITNKTKILKVFFILIFQFFLFSAGLMHCKTQRTHLKSQRSQTIFKVPGIEPLKQVPVALVLSPGLARGYAHVGVIQALTHAKIQIGAVLGTEMGALIAAIYAVSPTINMFEWNLDQYFRPELFAPRSVLSQWIHKIKISNKEESGEEKFESALKNFFGEKDLKDALTPIRIAVRSSKTGSICILEEGKIQSAVRGAMGGYLYKPFTMGKEKLLIESAAQEYSRLIEEAKKFFPGPVIVVDVLNEWESKKAQNHQEKLKKTDFVIRPQLKMKKNGSKKEIGYEDFSKEAAAAAFYCGKVAVNACLDQLRALSQIRLESVR